MLLEGAIAIDQGCVQMDLLPLAEGFLKVELGLFSMHLGKIGQLGMNRSVGLLVFGRLLHLNGRLIPFFQPLVVYL